MARRKSGEGKKDTLIWMVTFSDLITLMFTFFVLLLSMCSLEAGKIEQLQSATTEAMGVLNEGKYSEVEERIIMSTKKQINEEAIKAKNLYKQFSGLKMKTLELNMTGNLEFEELERGYSLIIRDDLLFDAGKAELKPDAFPVLNLLGDTVKLCEGEVIVEGHTDNQPVCTAQFPSNWELSSARAVSVVRYFAEHVGVDPALLSAGGYADTKPKVPHQAPDGRRSNRRVEIILVPEIIPGR